MLGLRRYFSFWFCPGGVVVVEARMYWHWRLALPTSSNQDSKGQIKEISGNKGEVHTAFGGSG